jgi:HAE1 family hydrophobic/amphiphilic exporter-1
VGQELRTHVDGVTPAKFRDHGDEYDVRVRLEKDQRDLMADFSQTYVPNINGSLVKLSNVALPVSTTGPSNIDRLDRNRFIQITADLTPGGGGMGGAIEDINRLFRDEIHLPDGFTYSFEGQAEDFKQLLQNMILAIGLGILFIYLVLSSLYESFMIPFAIMLVLPLAACGAFYALAITGQSLDIFSMIGCIMLMGLAVKNSILLVDYTKQKIDEGLDRAAALTEAGRTRLRPILMTSFALIAGMIPLAIGLNEASKQRVSLGISVIGGIVSSTFLTLLVVPAAFSYIDRLRLWSRATVQRIFHPEKRPADAVKAARRHRRKAADAPESPSDYDLQAGT